MNAPRTHFVYRIYDEFSLLLYVGCTAHPENRYKQHRSDKALWLPYVSKIRMEGPYTRAAGFAQEKSVIASEEPFFNALPSQMSHNSKRRQLIGEKRAELRAARPELFPVDHEPEIFAEYMRAVREMEARVDLVLPEFTKEWRLANYLNERRREVVVSA